MSQQHQGPQESDLSSRCSSTASSQQVIFSIQSHTPPIKKGNGAQQRLQGLGRYVGNNENR